jgi:hypothetical protein
MNTTTTTHPTPGTIGEAADALALIATRLQDSAEIIRQTLTDDTRTSEARARIKATCDAYGLNPDTVSGLVAEQRHWLAGVAFGVETAVELMAELVEAIDARIRHELDAEAAYHAARELTR